MSALVSRLLIVLVALGLGVMPAQSQDAVPARLIAIFDDWVQANTVKHAAIVVLEGDEVVASKGVHKSTTKPVHLASMSKAITGACVGALARGGDLSFYDDLHKWLGWSGDLGAITIAQLLDHTSGLKVDFNQLGPGWSTKPYWPTNAKNVLKSGVVEDKTYSYNNTNFMLLAVVIEAVTRKSYVEACSRITGKYASAKLSPLVGAYAPAGGWMMSLADYARFLRADVQPFVLSSPSVEVGGGEHYGPGVAFHPRDGKPEVWHGGGACIDGKGWASFGIAWYGPYSATVAWDGCEENNIGGDLEGRIKAFDPYN
jgi:CubicO group peptidase (beta-lactamase class C family)